MNIQMCTAMLWSIQQQERIWTKSVTLTGMTVWNNREKNKKGINWFYIIIITSFSFVLCGGIASADATSFLRIFHEGNAASTTTTLHDDEMYMYLWMYGI